MRMLSGSVFVILFVCCVSAFAPVREKILDSRSSLHLPDGKMIAVKAIDFVSYDFSYGANNASRTSYHLRIYLWVKEDLGDKTGKIFLWDANDKSRFRFNSFHRVGFDEKTGYYVYRTDSEVDRDLNFRLYAELVLGPDVYYSNAGHPDTYFQWEVALPCEQRVAAAAPWQ